MSNSELLKGIPGQPGGLYGQNSIDTGNVAVQMFKEEGRWRIKVSVVGKADIHGMRAGCNMVILPELAGSAKDLKDKVGRAAALLAKKVEKRVGGKFDACVDETDAYHGAVELLEECLIELHAKGEA